MNPLSRTTQTTPAATEQVGDTTRPPIADLTNVICIHHLFPYLGPKDLSHTSQVCHRFNDLSRRVWQLRAQEICRACAELLPSFGIVPPGDDPTAEEVTAFVQRTVRRVKEINGSLPGDLQSQFSAGDLVCKVDPGYMRELLQKAYDHSLRAVFGQLANVPAGASLDEATRLIREWLQTPKAEGIQELRLRSRGLCCLPREIGQLTALQWLGLSDNHLATLPPEIGHLTALQELYLSSNQLMSLPPEIGHMTLLQWLHLDSNQLETLPPEIRQLAMLQNLGLNGNRLASLPPEIVQLTVLHNLGLDSNQLASLPQEIGQLTALQHLFLVANQLVSLPPEIGQLTALQTLYLQGNQLVSLPPEIGRLEALQWLYLDGNPIASLPQEIGQLAALRTLHLEGTPLSPLPPNRGWLTVPR